MNNHALLIRIFAFRGSALSRDDEKIIFFADENKYFSPFSSFIKKKIKLLGISELGFGIVAVLYADDFDHL